MMNRKQILPALTNWRIALAILLLVLSGCSLVMPAEVSEMETRTAAAAVKMAKDNPGAFRNFSIANRQMGYVEIGADDDKPIVIFIHGSPGDWSGWIDYLSDAALMKAARLVSVDRPGFGRSGAGQVERSLVEQSRAIATLLDKAKPGQRVILVGHSFGGPVAARMAMDYGSKITDIVILAGSIDPVQEKTEWYQYPADWPIVTSMLPGELVVTNREIRALKAELDAMLPLWPRITQRVTVIQGGKDDLVPPANADFAEKMLTKASSLNIVRLPEANHFIPWTRYELVKAEIIKHLQ